MQVVLEMTEYKTLKEKAEVFDKKGSRLSFFRFAGYSNFSTDEIQIFSEVETIELLTKRLIEGDNELKEVCEERNKFRDELLLIKHSFGYKIARIFGLVPR